ncbi:MAG TPA: ATP-binding protein [Mycobacteriales bacterium]|nr:ATP-binding protein [Mycobacteriales bacterium]
MVNATPDGLPVGQAVFREFAADQREVAHARAVVRATCDQWGVPLEVTDELTLLVSELVTNAILHAASAVRLALIAEQDAVRLEVHDDLATRPAARPVSEGTAGGRGLHIVEAVTSKWGVRRHGAGKCIWAEVPVRQPGGPAGG